METTSSVPTAKPRSRLDYLDHVRILLTVLVIGTHTSITYGGSGGWYYREAAPSATTQLILTLHNAYNQAFFMGLFFFIAAYFTPASYERKGPWRFLKDRFLRLGLPVLAYDLLLHPLTCWLADRGTTLPFHSYLYHFHQKFRGLGQGPDWFILALLFMSLGYVAYRQLCDRAPTLPNRNAGAVFPGIPSLLLAAAGMAAGAFAVRVFLPIGWTWHLFNFQLPFFVQYVVLFAFGLKAGRQQWLENMPARTFFFFRLLLPMLVLALPAMGFLMMGTSGDISPILGGFRREAAVYATWEALFCIATSITLLEFMRRKWNVGSSLTRELGLGSYAAYLLHAPVLVGVALVLHRWEAHHLLKFVVVVALTAGLSFSAAAILRRIPGLRAIL